MCNLQNMTACRTLQFQNREMKKLSTKDQSFYP
uniref:Uncharacterized protein n=1 Tax=Anguilla anguilla TaxID=7936 RepID=A0A0E9V417_ANGAN